mgnify:FL=1
MKAYLLKKMQKNGCYLRETIQKDTNRSFGLDLLSKSGSKLLNVSYSCFDSWCENNYIEPRHSTNVVGVADLKFQYYRLNEKYRFDLKTFNIDLDELQINWNNYIDNFNDIVTLEDWNLVTKLLIRQPPIFTLDEILILSKFLIPAEVSPQDYGFFEQYATYTNSFVSHNISDLYNTYQNLRSTAFLSFHKFEDAVHGFVKLAKIRRMIRNRR